MITIPIDIDMSDLQAEFNLKNEDVLKLVDNVMSTIAITFANSLEAQAQKQLKKTKQRYLRSIQIHSEGVGHKAVTLDLQDPLVKMIEEGKEPFDMKPGFLTSPKVKFTSKGVAYLTIPFRWAVPTSIAENEAFSFKMPPSVYRVAKKKKVTIVLSGGGMRSEGLRFGEIPKEHQGQTYRPVIDLGNGDFIDEYAHRSNIFQGIGKYQDAVTGQNTYKSFRRVSANSDPLSWIHPGIKAYNLFSKALDSMQINIENELSKAIDNGLSALGFGEQ